MADEQGNVDGVIRKLPGGLTLRRATWTDRERLADFHAAIQLDPGQQPPNPGIGVWVLDLMSGSHPTFRPEDFMLVEEDATGDIVSSLCLISQTWTYAGVPVRVGQPELVSTRDDYRRRGLVRVQFEVVHEWSAARGEIMQGITGIPWYYRQFGYEMALPLSGARTGFTPHVPPLPEGTQEQFTFRPAGESDIPFMSALYSAGCGRGLVAALRDMEMWRYELSGRTAEQSFTHNEFRIIQSAEGKPVGMLAHKGENWGTALVCKLYELTPGVSWAAITPSVVRYLARTGEEYARKAGSQWNAFSFNLAGSHPVYDVFGERLPRVRPPYAWFVRVPDLAEFLRHVAPALEAQLARSYASGHTGDLKLNFYRSGLRLSFREGRLEKVKPWQGDTVEDGHAAFPDLTFLQLLFGRLSVEELEHVFADCRVANDETRALLHALFPKRDSNVWQIE